MKLFCPLRLRLSGRRRRGRCSSRR
uniref:Uncharacterized protein n=1 Tax=Arundo donax TaxID=35708 RepID=A0A0A9C751_ARUDO